MQVASGRDGFDVILDCVGGPQWTTLMDVLAPGGTLVHYGLFSGEPPPTECFRGCERNQVEMLRLRDIIHAHPRERLAGLFEPCSSISEWAAYHICLTFQTNRVTVCRTRSDSAVICRSRKRCVVSALFAPSP
ncbi:zinc-binding dehydrogenase [Microbacterium sp. VKM Ac-2870]|uniref:zinc-binding dehydrogenase n=1 Tax=Microbacterium sp. VKM Ac-2870 TaxID=2783825 RepID=UPI003A5C6362